MKKLGTLAGGLAVAAVLALTLGCPPSPPTGGSPKAGPSKKDEDHAHGAGPHGGALGDWGGDKYHIEFTVDHPKQEATVYILINDSKTKDDKLPAAPIKAKDGQLALKIKGPKSGEFQVVLKADPQTGDPEGKASRFVGKHEQLGVEQEFEGTVNGEADGTPYTGKFKEEPETPKK